MNGLSSRFFTWGLLLLLVASAHHNYGQPLAGQLSDHHVPQVKMEASAQSLAFGVPLPGPDGWGADDERGNGNTQGYATPRDCDARHNWFIQRPRVRARPAPEQHDAAGPVW